jgi:hypothetical protein
MNRTTTALAAAIGVAFLSVATPAMAYPDNGPMGYPTTQTRCIGDGPLYDHPEEYLPLCKTSDLVAYPAPVEPAPPVQPTAEQSPSLVTTGALGGIALAGVGLTGALVLRRNRRQQQLAG